MSGHCGEWAPYVSVAERRADAVREIERLRKKGQAIAPVIIDTRAIATTFWGQAWCRHLESYSDFEYRLPHGRSYVRNRAVLDLQIEPLAVKALVRGSRPTGSRLTSRGRPGRSGGSSARTARAASTLW